MSTTKYLNASTPDDVVKLDSSGRLPAVDGSQLTNISGGGGSGGVTVQDEGSALSTTATTLNFVGSGVAATGTGATKTITISGGGGGSAPVENLLFNPWFVGASTVQAGTKGNNSTIQYKNEAAPGWHYIAVGTGQITQDVITVSDDIKYNSSSPGIYNDFYGQIANNISTGPRLDSAHNPGIIHITEASSNNSTANLNRILTFTTYLRFKDLTSLLYGTPDAKSFTYSFWFKSQRAGTYIVECCGPDNYSSSGGGGYYSSGGGSKYYYYDQPFGAVRKISKSFSYTTANAWQKISVTIPGITPTIDSTWNETTDSEDPDDNFNDFLHGNMQVNIWLNCGSKYNSGSSLNSNWTASSTGPNDNTRCVGMTANPFGNQFWITRPQIESGTSASTWTYNELTKYFASRSTKRLEQSNNHHGVQGYMLGNTFYLMLDLFNVTKYLSDGKEYRPFDGTLLLSHPKGETSSGALPYRILGNGSASNASYTNRFWTIEGQRSSDMHINGALVVSGTSGITLSSTGTPYYLAGTNDSSKRPYFTTNYFETLR